MTEQFSLEQSPNQPEISPEPHFISNFHNTLHSSHSTEQYEYIEKLREKYGDENIKISLAMIDGKQTPVPEMFGIYVDAKKWAELNQKQ